MAVSSRGHGKTTIWTVSEFILGLMVANTLASTKMIRNMGMESTLGLMAGCIAAAGPKVNSTALGSTQSETARKNSVSGRMANELSGSTKPRSRKFSEAS